MDKKEDWNLELSEYIKQGETNQVEKTKTWETAVGLQDVDGLKNKSVHIDYIQSVEYNNSKISSYTLE